MRRHLGNILRKLRRALMVLIPFWLVFACALAFNIYLYGSIDRAQPTDVIVILGAGLQGNGRPGPALTRRATHAAELYRQGIAPRIICTGGWIERVQRTEASGCAAFLEELGVPADAILQEDQSRSTQENAANTFALMQAYSWQTAVVVTDGFHAMRAAWIFADAGIAIHNSPVPSSQVQFHMLLFYMAREVVALHWQFIKEVFGLSNTYVQGL
jgi:uncharacterized SAM-binding protein YcdF (DUF218 family)